MTKGTNSNFGVWSPNGDRIAFSGINVKALTIIPGDAKALNVVPPEPAFNATENYWPISWSRDGKRLAGLSTTQSGYVGDLVIYDVASKQYRSVKTPFRGGSWMVPVWLGDGRRVLVRTSDGISLVNVDTGAVKALVTVRGYVIGHSLSVARDNTWFSYTDTGTEGDVWVAKLTKSQK